MILWVYKVLHRFHSQRYVNPPKINATHVNLRFSPRIIVSHHESLENDSWITANHPSENTACKFSSWTASLCILGLLACILACNMSKRFRCSNKWQINKLFDLILFFLRKLSWQVGVNVEVKVMSWSLQLIAKSVTIFVGPYNILGQ